MLPGGTGSEIGAGYEDGCVGVLRSVKYEVPLVAPLRKQSLAETGPLDPFQPVARDDLIGVDVGAVQRNRGARDHPDRFHQCPPFSRSAGAARWPATAVAAATAGDTRWVRPPRP